MLSTITSQRLFGQRPTRPPGNRVPPLATLGINLAASAWNYNYELELSTRVVCSDAMAAPGTVAPETAGNTVTESIAETVKSPTEASTDPPSSSPTSLPLLQQTSSQQRHVDNAVTSAACSSVLPVDIPSDKTFKEESRSPISLALPPIEESRESTTATTTDEKSIDVLQEVGRGNDEVYSDESVPGNNVPTSSPQARPAKTFDLPLKHTHLTEDCVEEGRDDSARTSEVHTPQVLKVEPTPEVKRLAPHLLAIANPKPARATPAMGSPQPTKGGRKFFSQKISGGKVTSMVEVTEEESEKSLRGLFDDVPTGNRAVGKAVKGTSNPKTAVAHNVSVAKSTPKAPTPKAPTPKAPTPKAPTPAAKHLAPASKSLAPVSKPKNVVAGKDSTLKSATIMGAEKKAADLAPHSKSPEIETPAIPKPADLNTKLKAAGSSEGRPVASSSIVPVTSTADVKFKQEAQGIYERTLVTKDNGTNRMNEGVQPYKKFLCLTSSMQFPTTRYEYVAGLIMSSLKCANPSDSQQVMLYAPLYGRSKSTVAGSPQWYDNLRAKIEWKEFLEQLMAYNPAPMAYQKQILAARKHDAWEKSQAAQNMVTNSHRDYMKKAKTQKNRMARKRVAKLVEQVSMLHCVLESGVQHCWRVSACGGR